MLNALANHAYLPHNGQNITLDNTKAALDSGLNIPPEFGALLHAAAVRTSPDGNVTNQFNLDHLGRHNILEHDASLSRQDAFFGNNLVFDPTVFSETRGHWQETIDVPQAAAARMSRIQTSNLTNPTFGFTNIGKQFSVGESAAYLIVLGNKTTRTVNRTVVEYLFGKQPRRNRTRQLLIFSPPTEQERLPTEVGWTRPTEPLSANDLFTVMQEITNATANATGATPQQARRMLFDDLHAIAAKGAI